ncbi:VanZ family protein [Lapidilactobacillus bayanensis]|uniref:VanZ family protein n=1 Tax=Lapidilactobacillus bayanensis TaxID=2485998 RepID=UPI000F79867F|nr:VanZ family protein [Lapidilactobacillus bayanensis]
MLNFSNHYQPMLLINAAVVAPIFLLIFAGIVLTKKQKNWLNLLTWALLLIYLYLLFDVTIFPINWIFANSTLLKNGFGQQQVMTNFNLLEIFSYRSSQVWGNLLLLMPFTFLIALLNAKFANFKAALIIAFGTSSIIELSQLIMNYFYLGNRIFDLNDLILNTLGGLIGYCLLRIVFNLFPRLPTAIRK